MLTKYAKSVLPTYSMIPSGPCDVKVDSPREITKSSHYTDCPINEVRFIRKLKPSLNVQTDLIRAKVFT